MKTKICSKCGKELPLECFGKHKRMKDGLEYWCKECKKQHNKQYRAEHAEELKQYRTDHKAEKTAYDKQYRADHKEEKAAYDKQWRAEHADYFKQYYAEHKEEIAEYNKQWCSERYASIEGYAYQVRQNNLMADRKYGRCGKDEDILPPLEYYIWALQQRDFYDGKQYHWSEMGLDRIYNDKPHTFANVVPCSTKNNRRRHFMPFEEFCELI